MIGDLEILKFSSKYGKAHKKTPPIPIEVLPDDNEALLFF